MSCCVLSCVNNGNSGALPVDVTFYKIPKEYHLKQLWTEAIGVPEWQLGLISEVCSAHFRELDFTISEAGEKVLVEGAVPNLGLSTLKDLQAADFTTCRVCLSMDRKMYHIRDYNLHHAYKMIVGVMVESADRLPQMLCWECTSKLISFKTFKEKAQTSHLLLSDKLAMNNFVTNFLTIGDIKSINRINYNLKSHLTLKYCKPIEINVHTSHNRVDILQEIKEGSDEKQAMNHGSDSDRDIVSGRDIDSDRDVESGRNIDSDRDIDSGRDIDSDRNIDRDIDSDRDIESGRNIDRDIDSDSDIILSLSSSSLSLDSDDLKLSEAENTQARKLTVTKVTVTNMKLPRKDMKVTESEDVEKFQRVSKHELPTFEMRRLTLEEQLAEMQARAQSASYLAAPYKCDVCYRGFRSAGTLALHAVRHTDKCGGFECWVCKCRFLLARDVQQHMLRSHNEHYTCTICSFVTQNRSDCMRRTSAVDHQKWHAGNTYTCPHCPTTLTKFTSYLSHLRIKHSSRFACELCGYTFVSKRGVEMHKAKRHLLDMEINLDGPYCEECQLRFANDEAYQRHLTQSSVHSSDTHPDRIRNEWPQKPEPLKRAGATTQTVSWKPKEVDCEQCGERQVGYRAYAKHFRAAHPGLIRTKFKGKCMCEQCGRMFLCKALLLEHMAWHSGEIKFKCDTCDKKFTSKTALALHQRVHDEQAPRYSCPYCERKFKSLPNCNRHVKTVHIGEKEFQCEICDKQFTTADSKRSHVEHVHHKKPWPKRVRTRIPRAANRDK